jgi:hypothetical protein
MMRAVKELEGLLHSWKESISHLIRPGTEIKHQLLPLGTSLDYVLYLQFAYYGSLVATHSVFFYPWNLCRFGSLSQSTVLASQVVSSSEVVAEASRNIILTTKQVNANASSPVWYVLCCKQSGPDTYTILAWQSTTRLWASSTCFST